MPDYYNRPEQATDPEQRKLDSNPAFAQAMLQYQKTGDPRDWEEVRRQAQRITRLDGPELDNTLSFYTKKKKDDEDEDMGTMGFDSIMGMEKEENVVIRPQKKILERIAVA